MKLYASELYLKAIEKLTTIPLDSWDKNTLCATHGKLNIFLKHNANGAWFEVNGVKLGSPSVNIYLQRVTDFLQNKQLEEEKKEMEDVCEKILKET